MWLRAEQAGVGLMLGEDKGASGVVVKQLVPKGSADRNGRVRLPLPTNRPFWTLETNFMWLGLPILPCPP